MLRAALLFAVLACACAATEQRRPSLPAVTPLAEGSYQTGVTAVPALGSAQAPCPVGFKPSTEAAHLAMAGALLQGWFTTFAMPDLVAKQANSYACYRGTKCEQALQVSACVQEILVQGESAVLVAQGLVTYKCATQQYGRYGPIKQVGVLAAQGTYVSQETVLPPLVGGTAVPAVTALPLSDPKQLGRWATNAGQTIADITCPAGYQRRSKWGTLDQEDTMARNLVDDFFKKSALPALRRQGSAWGCPFGAKYADGDFFFPKAATVADANSKHTHTSSCFQKNPPAKGATAYMYAQGIINYYCLDSKGKVTNPERFTAIYTAAGRFTQPK